MALAASMLGASAPPAAAEGPQAPGAPFLVVAKKGTTLAQLHQDVSRLGGQVVDSVPQLGVVAVRGSSEVRAALATDSAVAGIGTQRLLEVSRMDDGVVPPTDPGLLGAKTVTVTPEGLLEAAAGISPDPGATYKGLQWDLSRMGVPTAWQTTGGDPGVTVGVADTGVDFTHAELAAQVTHVEDLSDPTLCRDGYTLKGEHVSDLDLAKKYGGPATGDWNGHGSWIGGNIAAALDGSGINGIAPKVKLVSLKIAGWCGATSEVAILKAILYAADHGIDVVNISFGGYTDRSDPAQDVAYGLYAQAVAYALDKGTVLVAAAGNESVRIGKGGLVLSHGPLTTPGSPFADLHGYYEVPGGLPGVVTVSATNNRVERSSSSCPASQAGTATAPNATCKPTSDAHQAEGADQEDQLAYYSNYGPRIDVAAPGGARKFNLPVWDRGGSAGFPVTDEDLTHVWQDFGVTSNWGVEIPCYKFTLGSGFPPNQCYTSLQGTSMAAPHAAGALALIASAHPSLRHDPEGLVARLKSRAVVRENHTPALSATDTSPGDLTGVPCPSGYCHLGDKRIPNREAYGAGLIDVARP